VNNQTRKPSNIGETGAALDPIALKPFTSGVNLDEQVKLNNDCGKAIYKQLVNLKAP